MSRKPISGKYGPNGFELIYEDDSKILVKGKVKLFLLQINQKKS